MMTSYERSDLLHIMKINRFTLSEADSACLRFAAQVGGDAYEVTVLAVERLPILTIKRNQAIVFNETISSIDDVKIFLEERLDNYLIPEG